MRESGTSKTIAARAYPVIAEAGFCPECRLTRRAALALGAGAFGAPGVRAQVPSGWPGLPARIATQRPEVQSVAVVQRGALVFDFLRAGLRADSLQDVQSVTKSVLALLFGCALADGHVRGVDELVALRLRRLRFVHLLTMTAGWPGELTARRDRDDDLRWLALRPFVAEPGTRFVYDNGAANLLALALANAVGRPLADYARDRLLAPLGISRFAWRRGAQGQALGALGLSIGVRDLARLGELVLAGGRWGGRARLPADDRRRAGVRALWLSVVAVGRAAGARPDTRGDHGQRLRRAMAVRRPGARRGHRRHRAPHARKRGARAGAGADPSRHPAGPAAACTMRP